MSRLRFFCGTPAQTSIGVGALWDGTAASGYAGSPPTDATRTTAKSPIRWVIADAQRFASDLRIGVDSDEVETDYVEFFVEGASATVSTWTRDPYTTVNGVATTRGGYFITLDHAAIMTQAGAANTNVINVYARTVPVDPTMQARTIGPLVLYPEATAHDWEKTVRLDGAGDYTSLKAALTAARTASAKSPKITISQTGFYELENETSLGWYETGKGYFVITHDAGVTATLGRASFPGTGVNTLYDPRIAQLEFRGSGIVIDHRNFWLISLSTTARGHRLNGCTVTSSEGTAYSLYWHLGYKPQGLLQSSGRAYKGVIEDCYIEYANADLMNLAVCRGNRGHQLYERLWNGSDYAADNFCDGNDVDWFRQFVDTFALSYTGAGSATFQKTGNNGVAATGQHLILRVDAVTVKDFALGSTPTETYYLQSVIAAEIDAMADWTATAQAGVDERRANYMTALNNLNSVAETAVTSTPVMMQSWIEVHSGGGNYFQGGGAPFENIIWRNNTPYNLDASSSGTGDFTLFLFDSFTTVSDALFVNQAASGANNSSGCKADSSVLQHVTFRNCTFDCALRFKGGADAWSVVENCIMADIDRTIAYPIIRNCISASTLPAGNNIENETMASVITNGVAGDFRPAGAALTLANLRPRLGNYDGRGNLRAADDAIGAWAKDYTAPVWP